MAFNSFEFTDFNGKPAELYRFRGAANTEYRYSTADQPVVFSGEEYLPGIVARSQIEQKTGELPQGIEIKLDARDVLPQQYVPFQPGEPVAVTIFRLHVHDNDLEAVPIFTGEVASVNNDVEGVATLTCIPIDAKLKREVPWPRFTPTCTRTLYEPGCNLNRLDWRVTADVTLAQGTLLTVPSISGFNIGYFRGGYVQRSNGDRRLILQHDPLQVRIDYPFFDVDAPETMFFFPGCDRLRSTCIDKFNNRANFLGFTQVPTVNPFEKGL